jgi:hypothetical protein
LPYGRGEGVERLLPTADKKKVVSPFGQSRGVKGANAASRACYNRCSF